MYHQCGLSDSSSAKWGRYCQSSDCDHWHHDILAVSPRCPMNSSRVHVFPKPTPLLQCPCFGGCLHHWPSCADRKPRSPVTPPHPTQHCTPRTWNTVGAQQTGILPEGHHSESPPLLLPQPVPGAISAVSEEALPGADTQIRMALPPCQSPGLWLCQDATQLPCRGQHY